MTEQERWWDRRSPLHNGLVLIFIIGIFVMAFGWFFETSIIKAKIEESSTEKICPSDLTIDDFCYNCELKNGEETCFIHSKKAGITGLPFELVREMEFKGAVVNCKPYCSNSILKLERCEGD